MNRRRTLGSILVLAFVALPVAGSGCKGEVVVKDTPETKMALEDCRKQIQDKNAYIKDLEKKVADYELKGGEDVVVTLSGAEMTITGVTGHGPNRRSGVEKGDAQDADLYEAFLRAVKKSRGRLKRCYQQALKKDSALQARSIPLKIQVKYRTDGKVSLAQSSPRISADFDRCMKSIAQSWTLPKMPRPVTFQQTIALTPE